MTAARSNTPPTFRLQVWHTTGADTAGAADLVTVIVSPWQVSTKDELDALVALDVFKYDPEYNTHEKEYEVGSAET
jgi:predicted P-loop ATPase/GTPase